MSVMHVLSGVESDGILPEPSLTRSPAPPNYAQCALGASRYSPQSWLSSPPAHRGTRPATDRAPERQPETRRSSPAPFRGSTGRFHCCSCRRTPTIARSSCRPTHWLLTSRRVRSKTREACYGWMVQRHRFASHSAPEAKDDRRDNPGMHIVAVLPRMTWQPRRCPPRQQRRRSAKTARARSGAGAQRRAALHRRGSQTGQSRRLARPWIDDAGHNAIARTHGRGRSASGIH